MVRKYFIIIVVLCVLLSGCSSFFNQEKNIVKLQIIEMDNTTNKKRVYDEYTIKPDISIKLHDKEFYECNRKPNDIKIINVEENYVTISRNKLKYDMNSDNKTYEEVVENINYNVEFGTSIDEQNPTAGVCSQAKYQYYLKFIKD